MVLTGYIVSIPIFCDSAFVILSPLVNALARSSGKSVLTLGIALAGGLMLTHHAVPPTPGPLGVAGIYDVDLGLMILWGIVFNACAFLALALVTSGTVALIITPLAALGAVVIPALQAMMSRAIPDNSQGGLQGLLTSAGALAMIVSPLIMSNVFWLATAESTGFYLPGAPFLLSMVLMGVCVVVFLGRKRMTPRDTA